MKYSVLSLTAGLVIILAQVSPAQVYVTGDNVPDQSYVPLTQDLAQVQVSVLDQPANLSVQTMRMTTLSAFIHRDQAQFTSASQLATPSTALSFPIALNSLNNAVTFINTQRATLPNGTKGLPATFSVPSSLAGQVMYNSDADRIIREGVGLYDTSLAIIAMVEAGNLSASKEMLDLYMQPAYGNIDLRAEPNFNGHDNGSSFKPFGPNAFYLFDFTRASGIYTTDWQYFTSHTGPNAWLILAIARYVDQARTSGVSAIALQPYVDFASKIGNGMLLLQNNSSPGDNLDHGDSQGCVRSAPSNTFHNPGTPDGFDVCNTENNITAYAALSALYNMTSDRRYKTGMDGIISWLQNIQVYVPLTASLLRRPPNPHLLGRPTGMMDPVTGMLYKGIAYNAATKRWEAQLDSQNHPVLAADSGGTWTISALGPAMIDSLFGPGAALRMWQSTRQKMGRSAIVANDGSVTGLQNVGRNRRLDGLDFSNLYPQSEGFISPEWTAGGINAIKQLQNYYGSGNNGSFFVSSFQMNQMSADIASMSAFIAQNPNSYAFGPGFGGSRQAQTGFDWLSPPSEVTAMASIYGLLSIDPLAWGRP